MTTTFCGHCDWAYHGGPSGPIVTLRSHYQFWHLDKLQQPKMGKMYGAWLSRRERGVAETWALAYAERKANAYAD